METLSEVEILSRIGLALALGATVGLERERQDKPAGLRTYALVCEGAALFMIGSLLLGEQMLKAGAQNYDPSRIGSTIVQGIGFVAGGVILTAGQKIRGLTTAAGIWVTAAVGLLAGAGFFFVAVFGTLAALLTLVVLGWVEHRFLSNAGSRRPSRTRDADLDDRQNPGR